MLRNTYSQNLSMHALAGAVSIAGSGDDLFSIAGGNEQLCAAAMKLSCARVMYGAPVSAIRRTGRHFTLDFATGAPSAAGFDAVVVATPLELTDIAFHNISLRRGASLRRSYQHTHVTVCTRHRRRPCMLPAAPTLLLRRWSTAL